MGPDILRVDLNGSSPYPLIDSFAPRVRGHTWSADVRWLAFIQARSSLNVWDSQTGIVTKLADINDFKTEDDPPKDSFHEVVWSSDNQQIALTVFDDDGARLLLVDIETAAVQQLFSTNRVSYVKLDEDGLLQLTPELIMLDWSPDGQMLLFYAEADEGTGMYVVDRNGDKVQFLLKTSVSHYRPHHVVWLSGP